MYPTDPPHDAALPQAAFPLVPEQTPVPSPRGRRMLRSAGAIAATLLLVGVPCALAVYVSVNKGSGDQLTRMIPADTDVYATALLDPSMTQKLNLQSVLTHFPGMQDSGAIEQKVTQWLDSSMQGSGFDYSHDLKPVLGTQIAGIVTPNDKDADGAVLFRVKDEALATQLLTKLKSAKSAAQLTWNSALYSGVTVQVGTAPPCATNVCTSSPSPMAYAVFDHTAVVASGETFLHHIIDTDHGVSLPLTSSSSYAQTLQELPADHLGLVYVNATDLIAKAKKAIAASGNTIPKELTSFMDQLDAYKSFGISVQAEHDAISSDMVSLTDPTKLSPEARTALSAPATAPDALGWVPSDAFAVATWDGRSTGGEMLPAALGVIGGLTMIGKQVDPATAVPAAPAPARPCTCSSGGSGGVALPPTRVPVTPTDPLQELGLTGPDGIQGHVTGGALEVGPGSDGLPAGGVLLLGTDDTARMTAFLNKMGGLAATLAAPGPNVYCPISNGLATGAPCPSTQVPAPQWKTDRVGNVDIHSLPIGGGFAATFAVADNMGIVGLDVASVRAAIDTHHGGASISGATAFRNSAAAGAKGSMFFVDLQGVTNTLDRKLTGADRDSFRKDALPVLRPMRTFTVTSTQSPSKQSSHLVLTVGG